jgi:hypothetical protein
MRYTKMLQARPPTRQRLQALEEVRSLPVAGAAEINRKNADDTILARAGQRWPVGNDPGLRGEGARDKQGSHGCYSQTGHWCLSEASFWAGVAGLPSSIDKTSMTRFAAAPDCSGPLIDILA